MLGDNIKSARKRKGLSQEALAKRMQVVRQTISKWENGLSFPDSDQLVQLATELDSSVNMLLDKDEKANKVNDTDKILETVSHQLFLQKLVIIIVAAILLTAILFFAAILVIKVFA